MPVFLAGLAKVAVKGAVKAGVKGTIKGTAKKVVKKKLSAKNIKSNLLKKKDQLKKIQIEREKQESRETVGESKFAKEDSGKGAGNVLGMGNFGFIGKIINVILTLIVSVVIKKLIEFREAIGKVISFIKPIWDMVTFNLQMMAKGIKFIFQAAGAIFGLSSKNKELKDAKESMEMTNKGINKELQKQEYSGEKDKDEEQEDKKDDSKKDDIIGKALKESSDFIESEATINQVDDKQNPDKTTNLSWVMNKVNKVVKGKSDKATSKLKGQSSQITKSSDFTPDKIAQIKNKKPVTNGLGPTQKMKNKGKIIIQPIEKVVHAGGGSGSSGGRGSSNVQSPVPSSSGSSMRIP